METCETRETCQTCESRDKLDKALFSAGMPMRDPSRTVLRRRFLPCESPSYTMRAERQASAQRGVAGGRGRKAGDCMPRHMATSGYVNT